MPLIMLDSGAYSVWSQGLSIDLDDYIAFCLNHPNVSYYVNLDVILGKKGDPRTKTQTNIEASCRQSFENYQKMISMLPMEKVIPVFHRGESFTWLDKYLDLGCNYIGIGQAGQRGWDGQWHWVGLIRRHLSDSSGKMIVKTHGFGITGFDLMKLMPWHSVDSASWIRAAAYGGIYIPIKQGGEYCYSESPYLLNCSPKSGMRDMRMKHIDTVPPGIRAQIQSYLDDVIKMGFGKYEIVDVPKGYKKTSRDGELWLDDKKDKIVRVLEHGLSTSHQRRFWANMKFIHKANDVIDVDHIYFAGAEGSVLDPIEFRLKRRLFSYFTVSRQRRALQTLDRWMEIMGSEAGRGVVA